MDHMSVGGVMEMLGEITAIRLVSVRSKSSILMLEPEKP